MPTGWAESRDKMSKLINKVKKAGTKKAGTKKTEAEKIEYRIEKISKELNFIDFKKGKKFLNVGSNKKMEEAYFFIPNINAINAFNLVLEKIDINLLSNKEYIEILGNFTQNNTICHKERCSLCSQYCYCEKSRFYQNNYSSRFNNLLHYLMSPEKMKLSINNQIAQEDVEIVRLHTEGDFFSPDYLKFWLDIVQTNTPTKFYSYTKQFEFFENIDRLPENFYLQISIDTKSEYKLPLELMKKGNVNIYLTYADDAEIMPFLTSNGLNPADVVQCAGKCKKCRNCYTNSGKIHLCKVH